jgi:hypothetical protein
MSVFAGPADWWTDNTDAGRTHIATKGIIQSGLVLNLDAGASASYPGSGTICTDLSGRGNNGTLTNGPTFSLDNGGVFNLDGTNDQIVCDSSSSLNITGPLTISSWIYYTGWNNYPGIITKGYATTGGYSLHIRMDYSLWFEIDESNGTRHYYNPTTIKTGLNAWYNTVAVYDGSLMQIYINGLPAGAGLSKSVTVGVVSNDVTIGNSQYGPGGTYLQGKVSCSKVYNKGLTQTEIQQNFNALRGRFGI